jgi:hypothetical protein
MQVQPITAKPPVVAKFTASLAKRGVSGEVGQFQGGTSQTGVQIEGFGGTL